MKKVYKRPEFKQWHDRRCRKIGSKPKRSRKYNPNKLPIYQNSRFEHVKAEPVIAPKNICLISKTENCLRFFNELRKEKNISKVGRICFVQMDLSKVEFFDYSTICVLIAIIGDLKSKGIILRGNYPDNPKVKSDIIESGLLTFMFDNKGKPFEKSEKSDLLFIEKGTKKLSKQDNRRLSETVKYVAKHLTGEDRHVPKLRTILLEICGNSIEWGGTINRQWLLGVKYENENAIFTVTDVGLGILKTLNKKFRHKLEDFFSIKQEDEVLIGAFVKKYGSSSKKINRNKGLPSIKNAYDTGIISSLKVLTNNVILHYEDSITSQVLKNDFFNGTLYRWIVTKDTILKAS